MKKNYWITSLLLTTVTLLHAGQPANPLHFDTEQPRAGQTVSFDYSASAGKLAGVRDLHAALFYYTAGKNTGYYATDLTISPSGKDNWKGSFVVPDSAVAFALRLRSGKITEDNNGRGYLSLVYSDGAPRPGAYAGVALLYSNGEYLLNLPNKADTALALLEKEFALHPELRSKYESSWYYNLVSSKKQEAYPILEKRAQDILAAPASPLADYKLAIRLFQLQNKKKTADSVLRIAAEKFPGSELAVQYDDNQFYTLRSLDSMILYFNQFNKKYPQTNPQDPAIEASTYFASSIVSACLTKKDYRNAINYTARINDVSADYRSFTYNRIAFTLLKNDTALALADSVIQLALNGLDNELAHPDQFKRQGATLSEWKDELNRYYYAGIFDTYAQTKMKKGEYKSALDIQQKAVAASKGENSAYNEHLVDYLTKSGDVSTAKERSEEYIKAGNASDSIKSWLKQAYVKEKGSDKGFEAYLAGLGSVAREKFREQALKEKLDIPSKLFTIPDVDGKNVSLASLKGKVVIVDFWATWCGPCKASFPAMQTTIDNYKSDTNVVFLFVDTWESMPEEQRLAAVKKFISDNKYSFHVLLDNVVDLEKRQYRVVSDYEVSGIPTKFIIDPRGSIVFKAVGFEGNNEKLLTEMSVYIDLAKVH